MQRYNTKNITKNITLHICHSLYYDAVCHRNLINEYIYIVILFRLLFEKGM